MTMLVPPLCRLEWLDHRPAADGHALATYLSGLNRLDEAERAMRRAIELQPAAAGYHQELAIIEVQRGDAQAALETAQHESPGVWQDDALALARQIGGERSAADAALKTLIEKDANLGAYQIAEVYALRDDSKATFEWLDRAWSNRDGVSSTSSTTPSSCGTRTIRASLLSAARSVCRYRGRRPHGNRPDPVLRRVSASRNLSVSFMNA